MTALFRRFDGDGPACHALVIGVSRYQHLEGGDAQRSENALCRGLGQLHAAASTAARVAHWLRDSFDSPIAGPGSIRLLLSPSSREAASEMAPEAPAATRANVDRAFAEWRRAVRTHEDNVAFVFVAGHGIQTSDAGGILLLEDFGDPDQANALAGAIDLESARRGVVSDPAVKGTTTPRHQFYFYDACRTVLPASVDYYSLNAGITSDRPRSSEWPTTSWVCFASNPHMPAYGNPQNGTTLFSDVLLKCLDVRAETQPDGRTVRLAELQPALEESLAEVAIAHGVEQRAAFGGGGSVLVPLHRRPPSGEVRPREHEAVEERGHAGEPAFRRVLFAASQPVPILVRSLSMRTRLAHRSDIPRPLRIGQRYQAEVPLPDGQRHVTDFTVSPGFGVLEIPIDVPRARLLDPRRGDVRPGDIDSTLRIRFLEWTGSTFRLHPQASDVPVVGLDDSGRVVIGMNGRGGADTTPTFAQLEVAGGRSPIVALTVGAQTGCEIAVSVQSRRIAATARPSGSDAVVLGLGYLESGRADYALMVLQSASIENALAEIRAVVLGYSLLKLDRAEKALDVIEPWSTDQWTHPDVAVIAGVIAMRNGNGEAARTWFAAAAERGIPLFSAGLSFLVSESRSIAGELSTEHLERFTALTAVATAADYAVAGTTIDHPDLLDADLETGWIDLDASPTAPA